MCSADLKSIVPEKGQNTPVDAAPFLLIAVVAGSASPQSAFRILMEVEEIGVVVVGLCLCHLFQLLSPVDKRVETVAGSSNKQASIVRLAEITDTRPDAVWKRVGDESARGVIIALQTLVGAYP